MPNIPTDDFVRGYATCALWTFTNEDGDKVDHDDFDLIAPDAFASMAADCAAFRAYCAENDGIEFAPDDCEAAGQDFWFTRNGHGAGFWDGDWADGAALTAAAKTFGSSDLYPGDDGLLYVA